MVLGWVDYRPEYAACGGVRPAVRPERHACRRRGHSFLRLPAARLHALPGVRRIIGTSAAGARPMHFRGCGILITAAAAAVAIKVHKGSRRAPRLLGGCALRLLRGRLCGSAQTGLAVLALAQRRLRSWGHPSGAVLALAHRQLPCRARTRLAALALAQRSAVRLRGCARSRGLRLLQGPLSICGGRP